MDICRALASCCRERPLSRGESGNGLAARCFSRADGQELTRAPDGTLATYDWPSPGDARRDPSLRAAGRSRRMAATNPDWRQSIGHRVRRLPICQSAPSAGSGTDPTDTTGALVLRGGDRAWRGTDARADLSRALPGRRPRPWPRGGWLALKRQDGHGHPGLRRPRCRDDRSGRTLGLASLPLPGPEIRVAKLVQSGCDLGLQSCFGGCSISYDQPGEPALSHIAICEVTHNLSWRHA